MTSGAQRLGLIKDGPQRAVFLDLLSLLTESL